MKMKEFQHLKFIIVHNFYEFYTESEINKYIQKDIKNCFDVVEDYVCLKNSFSDNPSEYYQASKIWIDRNSTSEEEEVHNPVVHLVMCNDQISLETIKKYNNFAIDYIRE